MQARSANYPKLEAPWGSCRQPGLHQTRGESCHTFLTRSIQANPLHRALMPNPSFEATANSVPRPMPRHASHFCLVMCRVPPLATPQLQR